jgi:hypothetical protein
VISHKKDLANVDWREMKVTLVADDFDNGRTPAQLRASFAASLATCITYDIGDGLSALHARFPMAFVTPMLSMYGPIRLTENRGSPAG